MFKMKFIVSILLFSTLLVVTSIIKNQTRVIEKEIFKKNIVIASLKKDLNETELDYFYLSSPGYLSKKINEMALLQYEPMDYSRIYLNYQDFLNAKKKLTTIKGLNEKKD